MRILYGVVGEGMERLFEVLVTLPLLLGRRADLGQVATALALLAR